MTTDTIESISIGKSLPIGKPVDPKDLFEAMKSPDWSKWSIALEKEHTSLLANKTWEVVSLDDILARHAVISCKWVFYIKSDRTFKCQWVARGFEQVEG
jgi:hypothetical protein